MDGGPRTAGFQPAPEPLARASAVCRAPVAPAVSRFRRHSRGPPEPTGSQRYGDQALLAVFLHKLSVKLRHVPAHANVLEMAQALGDRVLDLIHLLNQGPAQPIEHAG